MSLATILKQIEIFFDLSPDQLELIAALCQERRCQAGEIIFEENSPGGELYVILQGEVEIRVNPSMISPEGENSGTPATIATLGRGQSFGEVTLVDQGLRTATARAVADPTLLLAISRDRLIGLCDTHPLLGYHLMRNLAADLALKIRNTDLRIREQLLHDGKLGSASGTP
jgi:CRP/FNR family transcriptional regulator, cyclic AMP receptor protein